MLQTLLSCPLSKLPEAAVMDWHEVFQLCSCSACVCQGTIYKTTQSQKHKKSKKNSIRHLRHLGNKRKCAMPGRTNSALCSFKISSLAFPVRKHNSTNLCSFLSWLQCMSQMACSTFPNSLMIAAVPLSFIPPARPKEEDLNRII